jgi:hypothetical protein
MYTVINQDLPAALSASAALGTVPLNTAPFGEANGQPFLGHEARCQLSQKCQ